VSKRPTAQSATPTTSRCSSASRRLASWQAFTPSFASVSILRARFRAN
jgi:hypothetical protein